MKNTKLKFTGLLFLGIACSKPPGGANANSSDDNSGWNVTAEYRAPETPESPLKRTLILHGENVAQIYVDRQGEGEENWKQIGLTDDQGRFVDQSIEQKVRYRFGGRLVTPWYETMKTLHIASDISLPAQITGFHCIVDANTTLLIADKNLELVCNYVTILGNIYAFAAPPKKASADGANAGTVSIVADRIDLQGHIWLAGQDGARGGLYETAFIKRGSNGGNGGAGGTLKLKYKEISEVYDSLRFDGGKGGTAVQGNNDNFPATINGREGQRGRLYRYRL